ncbi:hypothetical protein CKO09_11685 [Chromatium weissei]|nr:hypothetical protein [Chromatium weissei]
MEIQKHLRISTAIAAITWILWLLLFGNDALIAVKDWWSITITMIFGSIIAGATSEGGGAVAFPVFTKLLHIAPWDAKLFALAIQSVGMTAASIVIVLMRIRIDWNVIRWTSIGGAVGMFFGAMGLAQHLPPDVTKMTFTIMVSSFGVVLYIINRRERYCHEQMPVNGSLERSLLIGVGLFGGMLSSIVGTGLDIVTFSLLVLLFRMSEKVATPTSVVLMAINSLVGCLVYFVLIGEVNAAVRSYWLAAVPVVVIGAPLGVLICNDLSRRTIVNVLLALISIELITTLLIIPLRFDIIIYSSITMLLFIAIYLWMMRIQRYESLITT